jgi:hypothetical protein
MHVKKFFTVIFLSTLLFGCDNNLNDKKTHSYATHKDTINVVGIINEFREFNNALRRSVKTVYYDQNYKRKPVGIGDTFIINVVYNSDKYIDLVQNQIIDIYRASGDFKVLGKEKNGWFKLAIGNKADTIQFDVYLKSKKHVFNDYYLSNGKIKHHIVDQIGLCRLTVLPK